MGSDWTARCTVEESGSVFRYSFIHTGLYIGYVRMKFCDFPSSYFLSSVIACHFLSNIMYEFIATGYKTTGESFHKQLKIVQ